MGYGRWHYQDRRVLGAGCGQECPRSGAAKVQLTDFGFLVKHTGHENVSFPPGIGIHTGPFCAYRRGRYQKYRSIKRERQIRRAQKRR